MKQKQTIHSFDVFMEQCDISKRSFALFCRLVFEKETDRMQWSNWKQRPKLCIINLPIRSNGIVHYLYVKNYRRARVIINIYPLLHSEKCSNQMKFFYLYATIVHELEHIHLLHLAEQYAEPNYFEMLAAWDQLYRHRGMGVYKVSDLLFSRKKGNAEKRSAASTAEIFCNIQGFMQAYTVLKKYLWYSNQKLVIQMIDSLEFILQNQEITYDNKGRVLGSFVSTIKQMSIYHRYNSNASVRFPMLKYLFYPDGSLISADDMIKKTGISDKYFYDAVLVRMFIWWDGDWNALFEKTEGLRERICELANDYCHQCITYLTNYDIARVFWTEEILQDNAAMLTKSICIIKAKMKEYEMETTVGGVFPLYSI